MTNMQPNRNCVLRHQPLLSKFLFGLLKRNSAIIIYILLQDRRSIGLRFILSRNTHDTNLPLCTKQRRWTISMNDSNAQKSIACKTFHLPINLYCFYCRFSVTIKITLNNYCQHFLEVKIIQNKWNGLRITLLCCESNKNILTHCSTTIPLR